jgi:protoporphyrinogen oxidase
MATAAAVGRDRDAAPSAIVIGAGPAGLTAAYLLASRGWRVTVVEQESQVGGLARTVEYDGYRFDIGGHRFFTKVQAVSDLWRAMLGPEFLRRPRLSRIYYNGRFFHYPLRPVEALLGLGVGNALLVLLSYLRRRLWPTRPERTFEDWVSNRFGTRLYRIFFKTYTEKVWGIPCDRISAQWAAQRIKGLSLWTAVRSAVFRRKAGSTIKTLTEEFEYPRFGPGQMWERFRREVEARGGTVRLRTRVSALHHRDHRMTGVTVVDDGGAMALAADAVLSTMPLRELVAALDPPAPPDVQAAAARLKYRDFLTVALIVDAEHLFPDNWIYVHDPTVKVGRIQNFKNWSPDMVPDRRRTCLGLEYFCFEGDGLWTMPDAALVELGRRELGALGLVDPARVIGGTVVRVPKAYPVYDEGYEAALGVVREYLAGFANLQVAGRNGMHKYNNQDHSMVTAMLAVRNLLGDHVDVWAVNADDEYHEAVDPARGDVTDRDVRLLTETQPAVPRTVGGAAPR